MQTFGGLHNNRPRGVFLGLIIFGLSISQSKLSLAQVANQEHAPASPSAAAVSPLPAIIKAFSGHWKITVKFESASGLPPGTEGAGQEIWRAAVGAKTLLSEESWKAGPIDMSLLGILWWDARQNKLYAMDCNNQGKSVCEPKDAAESIVVKWDGTTLIIEEPERGPDGKLVTSRVTFTNIKSDSFTEIDSLETSPGKFETMMTIQALRRAE